jgi:hypothetical protein
MHKSVTLLGFLFISFQSQAQWLATIKDPDGFANIRELPTIKSSIEGKFFEDEIFHIWDIDYDTIPNWRKVSLWNAESQNSVEGWMHISRIQELDSLHELAFPVLSKNGNTLTIKNDTIFFQIEFEKFDSIEHDIVRNENGYISSIDGKFPVGTDGRLPREGIKKINFSINGEIVEFPQDAYFDLYNFRKDSFKFLINRNGTIMIRSYNSDGGGFYILVWKFKNHSYQSRFVSGI